MAEAVLAYGDVRIRLTTAAGVTFDLASVMDIGEAFIETKDLDAGDPQVYKLIRGIILQMSKVELLPNLRVIMKTRNKLNQPFIETDLDASITDDTIKMRLRNCKYYRIRIQDNGVIAQWHLTRMDLYGAIAGIRL